MKPSAVPILTRVFVVGAIAMLAVSPIAPASHADGVYDQPVWFQWNARLLDVLILPADHGPIFNGNGVMAGDPVAEAHPCTNSYTRAMAQSARDWKTAIDVYGPAWLKGLKLNIYVAGCETVPPVGQITDAEIIVMADENKGSILGISVSPDTTPCLAVNSKMFVQSFTYNDMYSVAGHEFGHCLGLEHVTSEHPDADILDATIDEPIGAAANARHCPSNLNVNTLKGVYASAFGQPGAGVGGTQAAATYAQIAC